MKCPHCLVSFFSVFVENPLGGKDQLWDNDGRWMARSTKCPTCEKASIFLLLYDMHNNVLKQLQVWPKGIARSPLPLEVPEQFANDYRQACNVLADSPPASAALSRRSLQALLREKAGTKSRDLSPAIDEVIESKALPSDLANAMDAIRNIGNFGTHTQKSKHTGEIMDVEPGEAEWNLDVLENLFDFYFVRTARLAAQQAALNKKLAEAGKPPMKKQTP